MLKFLSKVKIEFNALGSQTAACMEFIAQCNAGKAKESNPACQVVVKRRTDDHPPQITVTYVNGVEEVIDAACTPAQDIRGRILERGRHLETEQMFREAGEPWPVMIPEEELHQEFAGTKVLNYESSDEKTMSCMCVNPGRLAKGIGGGTFVELNYHEDPNNSYASIIRI